MIIVCPFVLFLLAIVLSVLLRYTNFDYSFGGTRRVNLVTNPVISHGREKDRKKCLRQVEHICGHL
jgi:hypothetical protein